MRQVVVLVLMFALTGVAWPIGRPCAADAVAPDELDRLMPSPDTTDRGIHSDFFTYAPGRLMDLLGAGAVAQARALRPQACREWSQDRDTSPLSGRFRVQGLELDLDRICGLPDRVSRHGAGSANQ